MIAGWTSTPAGSVFPADTLPEPLVATFASEVADPPVVARSLDSVTVSTGAFSATVSGGMSSSGKLSVVVTLVRNGLHGFVLVDRYDDTYSVVGRLLHSEVARAISVSPSALVPRRRIDSLVGSIRSPFALPARAERTIHVIMQERTLNAA